MNVLELAQKKGPEIRKASSTKGGEWQGPCPGCGGEDRFHVWPEQNDGAGSWWCRGCGKGGDGIAFLMEFEGMDFKGAAAALGRDVSDYRRPDIGFGQGGGGGVVAGDRWEPTKYRAPEDLWREKAERFVEWCHDKLMINAARLAWLDKRGISTDAAVRFKIGWNPGDGGKDLFRSRDSWGLPDEFKTGKDGKKRKKKLWLPRGLVIPYVDGGGEVVRIRVRRPAEHLTSGFGQRFYVVPGSCMAPMVIEIGASVFVIVEAELDAVAIAGAMAQSAERMAQNVGVVAMGSSSARPDAALLPVLERSVCILFAMDFDKAGAVEWKRWWKPRFSQAKRWPVPVDKDPGEAAAAGVDLSAWVLEGMPAGLRVDDNPVTMGRSNVGLNDEKGAASLPVVDEGVAVVKKPADGGRDSGPARVLERLYAELKRYPVRVVCSASRTAIMWQRGRRRQDVVARVSDLIFHDPVVWEYLEGHPADVVDAGNFWDANKSRGADA